MRFTVSLIDVLGALIDVSGPGDVSIQGLQLCPVRALAQRSGKAGLGRGIRAAHEGQSRHQQGAAANTTQDSQGMALPENHETSLDVHPFSSHFHEITMTST